MLRDTLVIVVIDEIVKIAGIAKNVSDVVVVTGGVAISQQAITLYVPDSEVDPSPLELDTPLMEFEVQSLSIAERLNMFEPVVCSSHERKVELVQVDMMPDCDSEPDPPN